MVISYSPESTALIRLALQEDLAHGDPTSEAIFSSADRMKAVFRAREPLSVSGIDVIRSVFQQLDSDIVLTPHCHDGDRRDPGDVIAEVTGATISVLAGERTALNFLSRLSGVASYTWRCCRALGSGRARLVDTRKTTPGWRGLEKAAVRHGGGTNHRRHLGDGCMIKDNHIAAAGGITAAIQKVKRQAHHLIRVEVEVDHFGQLAEVLEAGADVIMLDNFTNDEVEQATRLIRAERPEVLIELSGGMTLERLPSLQALDIDFVSMGALTHGARSVDIGLDFLT